MFRWPREWKIKEYSVQSPRTFLVKNVFFLQLPRKHDDWSAFKYVFNEDCGFKAAFWTLQTKMVTYIITAKLNSTFGTIGKAMAVRMTAKVVGKNTSFLFSVKSLFEHGAVQRSMSVKFLNISLLLNRFLLRLYEKLLFFELPFTLLSFQVPCTCEF